MMPPSDSGSDSISTFLGALGTAMEQAAAPRPSQQPVLVEYVPAQPPRLNLRAAAEASAPVIVDAKSDQLWAKIGIASVVLLGTAVLGTVFFLVLRDQGTLQGCEFSEAPRQERCPCL